MREHNTRSAFESGLAYRVFEAEVRQHARYIRSASTKRFLDAVTATSNDRIVEIPTGRPFWRAQVGNDWQWEPHLDSPGLKLGVPVPYPKERMRPLAGRAIEGRVNPKGISCLYLATTEKAAISEVRPWVGSMISVGQFEVTRTIHVVDCSKYHDQFPLHFFDDEPPIELWDSAIWTDIDRAFAEPVTRVDDTADYAPTQILAELFRSNGADGVMYKSAFGDDGYSVALFDLNTTKITKCNLRSISGIEFESVDLAASYRTDE